jgi:hypothetical protein
MLTVYQHLHVNAKSKLKFKIILGRVRLFCQPIQKNHKNLSATTVCHFQDRSRATSFWNKNRAEKNVSCVNRRPIVIVFKLEQKLFDIVWVCHVMLDKAQNHCLLFTSRLETNSAADKTRRAFVHWCRYNYNNKNYPRILCGKKDVIFNICYLLKLYFITTTNILCIHLIASAKRWCAHTPSMHYEPANSRYLIRNPRLVVYSLYWIINCVGIYF